MTCHGVLQQRHGGPGRATEVHRIPGKFPRISMAILWNSVDIYGALRSCVCGKPRNSMVFQGYPRSSTVGFLWKYKIFHGEPWSFSVEVAMPIHGKFPRTSPETREFPWRFMLFSNGLHGGWFPMKLFIRQTETSVWMLFIRVEEKKGTPAMKLSALSLLLVAHSDSQYMGPKPSSLLCSKSPFRGVSFLLGKPPKIVN